MKEKAVFARPTKHRRVQIRFCRISVAAIRFSFVFGRIQFDNAYPGESIKDRYDWIHDVEEAEWQIDDGGDAQGSGHEGTAYVPGNQR